MTWNNQNCAEKGAKITLLALYEKTIYQNEKNGFCIFRMASEDTGIPKELGYGRDHKIHFSVIGYYLPAIRNSMLALTGVWENSRYGLQFHVDSYTEVITKNKKRYCSISFLWFNQGHWESNGGFNCSKVRDRYTGCD